MHNMNQTENLTAVRALKLECNGMTQGWMDKNSQQNYNKLIMLGSKMHEIRPLKNVKGSFLGLG